MPRSSALVELKSLEFLCVQSVAKNLGKVKMWSQSNLLEDDGSNYSSSPFDALPPFVFTSVFDTVKKFSLVLAKSQEDDLGLLMSKKLEELDLNSFHGIRESRKFHLLCIAALRRLPLKTLKFCFLETPHLNLQHIFPAFPNLQVLDVSCTNSCFSSSRVGTSFSSIINDSFLSLIASSCPQLKSLDLADCVYVTDDGMQQLCTSSESSTVTGGGICGTLVKLNIHSTKVTQQGARLALENLTNLQEFNFGNTIQVILEMYRNGGRRPLSLRNLDIPWISDENSLATAIQICPSLVHLFILPFYEPSSQDLRAFLNLDNLKGLILLNASGISFEEDILPVLQKFGRKSLECLHVSQLKEANLGAIVEHCSNLRSLSLLCVGQFTPSRREWDRSAQHLPSLQRLHIRGTDQKGCLRLHGSYQPTAADLSLVLSSAPALVELKLEQLDHLSDGILEQAIAQHGFPDLESLQIISCPNVTKGLVELLLELDNPLSSIVMERYRNYEDCELDESEVHDNMDPAWKEKIERDNLNLSIYCCECGGQ